MTHFVMRKDLISIGGDFSIEDAEGNVVYDVDRKVRFATTFSIKDREGRTLVSAKEKLMALDDTILLTREDATVATVRAINPNVRILARTSYVREAMSLRSSGASGVFAGEGEVAFAMMEAILRDLGATPEQIDRERSRVRAELLGS
jgi:LURP-one-related